MGLLIPHAAMRKTIGVLVDDQQLVASLVAWTPLGPVEVERVRESYITDDLTAALDQLLRPLLGTRRFQGAVGLSARKVFCTTRPDRDGLLGTAPEMMLQNALRSRNVIVDDMAIDVIRSRVRKGEIVSLASCRKRYLSGVLASLNEVPLRLLRVEPAPCALARVAAHWQRKPLRARTVVRLVLGQGRGMAILVTAEQPLIWRVFDLPPTGLVLALASVVRSMRVMGTACGMDEPADALIVHGRPDLLTRSDIATLKEQFGVPILRCSRPELGDGAEALGLALGCQVTVKAFDLARLLKPPASIRDVFPFGELAVQAALILCAGLFLYCRADSLKAELARAGLRPRNMPGPPSGPKRTSKRCTRPSRNESRSPGASPRPACAGRRTRGT